MKESKKESGPRKSNGGEIFMVVFYFVMIWWCVIRSYLSAYATKSSDPVWFNMFLSYFLLGFGDIFHLTPHLLFAVKLFPEKWAKLAFDYGGMITSLTNSYFFVTLAKVSVTILGSSFEWIIPIIQIIYAVDVVLKLITFFNLVKGYGRDSAGRFILTSVAFYLNGAISLFLAFKTGDERFFVANIMLVLSFVSLIPCLLARYVQKPALMMFMGPYTIFYLAALYFHYTRVLMV